MPTTPDNESTSTLLATPANFGPVVITKEAERKRNEAVTAAAKVVQVIDPPGLEKATLALRAVSALIKDAEADAMEVKRPRNAWLKTLGGMVADFLAPAEREKLRLTGLVNHYQRKKLEEAEERARQAEREKAKAEEEARKAQAETERLQRELEAGKLSKARREKIEADLLDAQLSAEDAALAAQAEPEKTLAVAEPRGLTTKVRLNFEITDPHAFIQAYPEFWKWKAEDESFKLDRRRLLEELNSTAPNRFQWLKFPEEQPLEGIPRPAGCRVFRDVSSHTRGY